MKKSYSEYQRKSIIDAVSKTTDVELLNEMYTTLMTFILEAERQQGSEPALNAAGSEL